MTIGLSKEELRVIAGIKDIQISPADAATKDDLELARMRASAALNDFIDRIIIDLIVANNEAIQADLQTLGLIPD